MPVSDKVLTPLMNGTCVEFPPATAEGDGLKSEAIFTDLSREAAGWNRVVLSEFRHPFKDGCPWRPVARSSILDF
jgi:hypothetical protein